MTNPTIRIHNTETDEVIDREMNAKEFAQYEKDQSAAEVLKAADVAQVDAKTALLERLGITAEEAKLLLG